MLIKAKKFIPVMAVIIIITVIFFQGINTKHIYTKEERLLILNIPAVHSTIAGGEKYNMKSEKEYLEMSDTEFDNLLKSTIIDNIKRKATGEDIKWDKTFVDTIIKDRFPKLYDEIQEQMRLE